MIAFHCRDCQSEIQRPDDDAGKTIFCPKCYFALIVPQSAHNSAITVAPQPRAQTEQIPVSSAPVSADEYVVVCPRCFHSTDSLKAIEIRNVYFLILFITWNREYVIGCPGCVRGVLYARLLLAIIASNILFPIMGTIYLLQYFDVGFPGHSDAAVAHAHRMPINKYIELPRDEQSVSRLRDWIIAACLILVICGIAGMVIYRLSRGW